MKPLNQYSRNELIDMHINGALDRCPVCGKYHNYKKPKWPYSNVNVCDDCKKKREKRKV